MFPRIPPSDKNLIEDLFIGNILAEIATRLAQLDQRRPSAVLTAAGRSNPDRTKTQSLKITGLRAVSLFTCVTEGARRERHEKRETTTKARENGLSQSIDFFGMKTAI